MKTSELDAIILDAFEQGDGVRLAELYRAAGEELIDSGSIDSGCFFLTQSYVYALENGIALAGLVRRRLVELGREK